MVLSSFAFVLNFLSPDQGSRGSFKYEIRDGMIYVNHEEREVNFYFYPDPNVYVPDEALSLIRNADIVVVAFDPNDAVNAPYIEAVRFDFSIFLDASPAAAILSPSDEYSYPIMDCEGATPQAPYIKLVNGTGTITVNGSCVTIAGYQQQLLNLRDQFLYRYLGVV